MPSGADPAVETSSREKPAHHRYLWDFRVEQCPYFPNYKCNHHKPYTCFFWHFPNQRRRRPMLKPDGTFNYSPDVYCVRYDEITGVCPARDECPFLHRTLGDTERRYHPRYYKTSICVHDVGAQGHCVKNGPHCAFAHGSQDLRSPVYGIVECHLLDYDSRPRWVAPQEDMIGWVSCLHDEPNWNDLGFVLINYKADPCRRPPHLGLCRLGLTCPNYHDRRDRRRTPLEFRYSSTPCPNVRQGTEWSDTENCADGDKCTFCHSRTEQKFHPDIYKSTMCNDLQRTNYCPRGPFCSFAHSEREIQLVKKLGARNLIRVRNAPTISNLKENDKNDLEDSTEVEPTKASCNFERAPGSGRCVAESVKDSNESSNRERSDVLEVVTSVVTNVLSCSDLPIDKNELKNDQPSVLQCLDGALQRVRTLDDCALGENCASLWDPLGIWGDQCTPKSCITCAAWRKEARASARRERIAEEEKQEALAKLMQLERRLHDVMYCGQPLLGRVREEMRNPGTSLGAGEIRTETSKGGTDT